MEVKKEVNFFWLKLENIIALYNKCVAEGSEGVMNSSVKLL